MTSDTPAERLETPVWRAADLARLGEADLERLARWVSEARNEATTPPSSPRRRLLVLSGVTLIAIFLVPWATFLARSLPNHIETHEWSVAWVGFDAAMVVAFGATAWLGWRRRQLALSGLLVAAVLLCCDAWFDVTLSWGSGEQWASVATAALAEVPIAIFLLLSYRRLLRILLIQVRRQQGVPGDLGPLWRQPLLLYPHPGLWRAVPDDGVPGVGSPPVAGGRETDPRRVGGDVTPGAPPSGD